MFVFLHDGQGADRQGILFVDRSYYHQVIIYLSVGTDTKISDQNTTFKHVNSYSPSKFVSANIV